MKILEVIHGLNPGGAERFVVDLCNELSINNEVSLLLIKDVSVGNSNFYISELSPKVKVVKMNFLNGFHITYPFKLFRMIRQINPEVVHIHCVLKYCLLALLLDSWKRKYFMTLHIDIQHIKKKIDNVFAFNTFGRLKRLKVIGISKTNNDEFHKEFPFCESKYINNGRCQMYKSEKYDSVVSEINSYKKNNDTIVFLNVARCSTQKNHKLLLHSFDYLKEENVICLIIGNGFFDTELGTELTSMAPNNVFFLGTRLNIYDYMCASDAFCMSSDFEGMPITVIEAIMAGLPILSTNVCGVKDVVKHNVNGLLCEPKQIKPYVEMLQHFLCDMDKFKNESEKDSSKNRYLMQTCAGEYIEFFKI